MDRIICDSMAKNSQWTSIWPQNRLLFVTVTEIQDSTYQSLACYDEGR